MDFSFRYYLSCIYSFSDIKFHKARGRDASKAYIEIRRRGFRPVTQSKIFILTSKTWPSGPGQRKMALPHFEPCFYIRFSVNGRGCDALAQGELESSFVGQLSSKNDATLA